MFLLLQLVPVVLLRQLVKAPSGISIIAIHGDSLKKEILYISTPVITLHLDVTSVAYAGTRKTIMGTGVDPADFPALAVDMKK